MAPPNQYRPIQPAPVKGSATSSTNWLAKGLTKRLKAVTQACHTCRRNKAKCDGVRPRCGGCATKGSACGYEGEAGQSRQAALRARLESLEKLVSALQSKPDDEALRLLQRLRSADDVSSVCDTDTIDLNTPGLSLEVSSASSESSFATHSLNASLQAVRGAAPPVAPSSDPPAVTMPPRAQQRLLAAGLAEYLSFAIPCAQTTWAGVQSFFSSCGRLFHIYSQQQLEVYYRMVFGIDGKPDTSQKLAICCLSAVAAVGIQYNPDDFEKGLEKVFHDVSRRFFAEVVEERVLDTIKVCTLFAMYYIMDKATAALAYVEVGLSMSKRQSQNTGVCHPSMVSTEDWLDFRRTWRALLFFSSWLSSTLGYISGADNSDEFAKVLPVADQDHDSYNPELGEIIQAEMTKLTLLKAGILRSHLAVRELTMLGMDGIIRELQDWYGQLPEQIKLSSLDVYKYDWAPIVRWSIYHLHILYHGAPMLVYRRIAAHCVRLQRTGGDLESAARDPTLLSLVEQGLTSAKDTAILVNLLFSEQGVFRRCWIVIFQTHTACVVILHSVAQKQLHRFPPSSWAEDMKRARQCLDVLEHCGKMDPVALRFRVRLSGIYSSLSRFVPEGQTPAMQRVEDWVPPPPDQSDDYTFNGTTPAHERHPIEYLFTIPPDPNPQLLSLSFSLLFALCRPWSDTATLTTPLDKVEGRQLNPENQSQLLEALDWDFGKVTPFRWDTDGMGMLKQGEAVDPSCFLDSESPSGWALAEDLEVDMEEGNCKAEE
ncbi:hypothetical protein C8A03DRAFT_43965 [Achaetomium macrosporum]|uniref:Zn(2)-C6 fungal-type domain-containing protein n=1 Tax=Achaetomium macrosporum TaxID=79813 RepID=A0AAN7CB46_9PEZI|nr:hypothetical protein C8A03DRAFT_43965 [Achaetomium macrosporum]